MSDLLFSVGIVAVFLLATIIEPLLIYHFWCEVKAERKVLKACDDCVSSQEVSIKKLISLLRDHNILTEEEAQKFEFLRRHWGKAS